jgi:hypothetical protein
MTDDETLIIRASTASEGTASGEERQTAAYVVGADDARRPLPGLRNVERYAEWVEACEYDSRRAAGPWWLLFLEAIDKFVCEAIVAMGLMAAAGKCVDCAKVATHQKCARGPESGHPFGTPLCTTHACPDCTPYTALAVNGGTMTDDETLIIRARIAAGCSWDGNDGGHGNKTEPQEPEVRRILRECANRIEILRQGLDNEARRQSQSRGDLDE